MKAGVGMKGRHLMMEQIKVCELTDLRCPVESADEVRRDVILRNVGRRT